MSDKARFRRRTGTGKFLWLLLAASVLLTGCSEATDVTLHEPGVYKGSPDPLLEKSRGEGFGEQLRERLKMVQTDR